MVECKECTIRIGLKRSPRKVFDEIESVSAEMIRDGWILRDYCYENGMEKMHLLFERNVGISESTE